MNSAWVSADRLAQTSDTRMLTWWLWLCSVLLTVHYNCDSVGKDYSWAAGSEGVIDAIGEEDVG